MLVFNWDINNDKIVGKSTCNKYVIEIFKENDSYSYYIKEGDKIVNVSQIKHENIQSAQRNSTSLISIRYALI